ncbi:aminoglycoside phosphotransferase family protein [Streptomyces sp. UNOC14_S4]|uniref:aminoglycoside phosphotransferase family protein n=1 Tax=Streptomyces sp. UNOC14_S4 TaxID=2872340 RepID=UPI001E56A085|nr:aminoglycoside phosphotransferase family protein [Streptomyces sp. UNOC14_S4]MCC3769744.1 aminoglycoside phosphotransferase family protein [Streptomyces sp. UNOC14_S4]
MSGGPKALPDSLLAWAEASLGAPVLAVHDASAARPSSRVWELARPDGTRYFLKCPAGAERYARETFAYRHAVPALGPGCAPRLLASDATLLALLVTALPGASLASLRLTPAGEREAHRRAGALLSRLHAAGRMPRDMRPAAEASLRTAAETAEEHLRRAGDHFTRDERRLARQAVRQLRRSWQVPLCFTHGDARARNLLCAGRHTALVDFGQARFAAAVHDFVLLSTDAWAGRPDLRAAFFAGYGRELGAEERHVLRCLAVADTVGRLARGASSGEAEAGAEARGRLGLQRLLAEGGLESAPLHLVHGERGRKQLR